MRVASRPTGPEGLCLSGFFNVGVLWKTIESASTAYRILKEHKN